LAQIGRSGEGCATIVSPERATLNFYTARSRRDTKYPTQPSRGRAHVRDGRSTVGAEKRVEAPAFMAGVSDSYLF